MIKHSPNILLSTVINIKVTEIFDILRFTRSLWLCLPMAAAPRLERPAGVLSSQRAGGHRPERAAHTEARGPGDADRAARMTVDSLENGRWT